ncbi:SDR family oxidoreductase [Gordonia sp. HY285]|uniref:SDR family oxidoreductase n=1 Tax=Gordonia liuliyuniae TaxID=2911517 RepID=A0ABS9ITQ0_9ACTN|nr:SDR family NAD(P)-dependent oxidoreductase [Gordonia liuliyuniae]MCF8588939.1 SDR family oxidoreductase [Gordonia liuliyuniae]MCF8609180.1 SDR family oxidoreductase [Gordonia liuliyuniae]
MLTDKRVLVTGAAKGMGRDLALEAARQGASHIGVTDVDAVQLAQTVQEVAETGARVHSVTADLRSTSDIEAMVEEFAGWAGGLDSLFNNAGVLDHMFTPADQTGIETLHEDVWTTVMDINLKAVWSAIKFAAPHLRESDRGPSVVNAASVSGLAGTSMVAYGVSKAAVIQLTKVAAVNLSPHVRVNCYCPGSIRTPMSDAHLAAGDDRLRQARSMYGTHLIPRRGLPVEVARTACFLASDSASFLTGVVLPVDGGTMAWRGTHDDVPLD